MRTTRMLFVSLSVVLFSFVGCAAPRSAFTVAVKARIKETEFTEVGTAVIEYTIEPTFRR